MNWDDVPIGVTRNNRKRLLNMRKLEENGFVEITDDEYEDLLSDRDFLMCLYACGLDQWEGYDEACEMAGEDGPWDDDAEDDGLV